MKHKLTATWLELCDFLDTWRCSCNDFEAAIFDFWWQLLLSYASYLEAADQEFFGSRGIPLYTRNWQDPLLSDLKKGAEWAIATHGLKEDPEEIVAEWKSLVKLLL